MFWEIWRTSELSFTAIYQWMIMMLILSVILALSCCHHYLVEQVIRLRVPASIPHRNFWLSNVIILFITVLIICCVQDLTKIILKVQSLKLWVPAHYTSSPCPRLAPKSWLQNKVQTFMFFSNLLFAKLIFHIWLSWFIGIYSGKDNPIFWKFQYHYK